MWLPGPAHRRSPDLSAGLAARFDRDPGWSPWPTPQIQTRTSAFTAPRATSLARSPTSLGHGWPRHLPCQRLPSRTAAATVLTRSKPASSRPSAGWTRPWPATPGDLAGLLADMEGVWVAVGAAVGHRYDPEDCHPAQMPWKSPLPVTPAGSRKPSPSRAPQSAGSMAPSV
jgi:hypothetical protein